MTTGNVRYLTLKQRRISGFGSKDRNQQISAGSARESIYEGGGPHVNEACANPSLARGLRFQSRRGAVFRSVELNTGSVHDCAFVGSDIMRRSVEAYGPAWVCHRTSP